MSDCLKCWETPCACGWDYRSYNRERRYQLAAVVLGVQVSELKEAISIPETHPTLLNEAWEARSRPAAVKSQPEALTATLEGKDHWGRAVITLEHGVRLCDIHCLDLDVIKADPSRGDWHTMSPDLGEPDCRFNGEIKLK